MENEKIMLHKKFDCYGHFRKYSLEYANEIMFLRKTCITPKRLELETWEWPQMTGN